MAFLGEWIITARICVLLMVICAMHSDWDHSPTDGMMRGAVGSLFLVATAFVFFQLLSRSLPVVPLLFFFRRSHSTLYRLVRSCLLPIRDCRHRFRRGGFCTAVKWGQASWSLHPKRTLVGEAFFLNLYDRLLLPFFLLSFSCSFLRFHRGAKNKIGSGEVKVRPSCEISFPVFSSSTLFAPHLVGSFFPHVLLPLAHLHNGFFSTKRAKGLFLFEGMMMEMVFRIMGNISAGV